MEYCFRKSNDQTFRLISPQRNTIDEEYAFEYLTANVPRHPQRNHRRPPRRQNVGREHRNRRAIHRPRTHPAPVCDFISSGPRPRVCQHHGGRVQCMGKQLRLAMDIAPCNQHRRRLGGQGLIAGPRFTEDRFRAGHRVTARVPCMCLSRCFARNADP